MQEFEIYLFMSPVNSFVGLSLPNIERVLLPRKKWVNCTTFDFPHFEAYCALLRQQHVQRDYLRTGDATAG